VFLLLLPLLLLPLSLPP
jgi:hypothetical protein